MNVREKTLLFRWLIALIALVSWACAATAPPSEPQLAGWNDSAPLPGENQPGEPFQALTAAVPPPPLEAAPSASVAAKGLAAFPVFTEPGDLPSLVVARAGVKAGEGDALPLKETRVSAKLREFSAEVEVTQRYENPHATPIEAIYVFPLPENSAVSRMQMTVGDRVIEAKIDERDAARKTYERAKREGFAAALLEQERPNVFTQSVANIEPQKSIEVTVRYVQDLSYDSGIYEFVFPLVIGPRFMQGAPVSGPQTGSGIAHDTTMVNDASRVSPPYIGKGERSGRNVKLEILADPALALSGYEAVSHQVDARKDESGLVRISLSEKDNIPNRDFVLRYRVAGEKPRATLLMSPDETGFFSLAIDPPNLPVDELVGRREIVFVVDISGSMAGQPLALCKEAMRIALGKIRPVDTFNVITFAGSTARAFESARPANDANVRLAMSFVERMRAGGGTMMLDAVATALSPNVAEGRGRYVFFLTDGFVGVEDQIIKSTRSFVSEMEKKGQRAKVFGFGVGSAPNRALLDGLSREGKGVPVYAGTREDPARAVNQFFRYIDRSVLRDVSVDWGGAKVSEVLPAELPDLFASHPLIVHGKIAGKPSRPPVVHATSASGPIQIPVEIVAAKKQDKREVLGLLWARSKVAVLDADFASGDPSARATITKLGKDFGLVTRFTSFVAVDNSRRVGDGEIKQVVQPHERPEGMSEGNFRGPPAPAQPPAGSVDRPSLKGDSDGVPDSEDLAGQRTEASAPAPYERGKRGCMCRVGAEPGSERSFWGGALLALAVGLRRWARRGRRGRSI